MGLIINRFNFFLDFFEKRRISGFYQKRTTKYDKFLDIKAYNDKISKKSIVIVNCIPPYLGIDLNDINEDLGCFESSHRLGYAMDLKGFSSAREFLRNQLGKKPFKNLRQDRQRFERYHNVTFEIYHGKIDEACCQNLIDTLKGFIEIRFQGKASRHAALKRWSEYEESVKKEINSGNASFFVNKIGKRIIAIALNYHFRDILYAAIISFDPEFHRYSPGRQMFYRQVEWCFENNYRLIDLAWGNFDYKIKFSNAVYKFRTHAIYPKKNFRLKVIAFVILHLTRLKYYLVQVRDRKWKNPSVTYQSRWLEYTLE
ncbi:GNAT family N-acetyltransferase [Flavobacteriaceae bacterium D16]|nr:GNAT family N-acetyltransferase [Flavobacteriaceae bacterium D16]